MMPGRRALLSASLATAAGIARAEAPLPLLAAFEQATGGRIGVFAENLSTGAKLAWRAGERFLMCSTFKLSRRRLA
jgi:beta-lactamase class A